MTIAFFRKASRTSAYPSTATARSSTTSVIRRHPVRSAGVAGAALLGAAVLAISLQSQAPAPAEMASADESATGATMQAELREEAATATVPSSTAEPAATPKSLTIDKATRIAVLEPADTAPGLPDETRWAATGEAGADRTAARELAALLGEQQQDRDNNMDAFAQAFDLGPDRSATTAAIDSAPYADAESGAVVAVAESDVEVAALENRLASQNRDVFAVTDDDVAGASASGQGIVTSYVNMRAAPENDADILKVLPERATVAIVDDCPNWCEVEHEGVRGFVFGSFLDRQAASTVSAVDRNQ